MLQRWWDRMIELSQFNSTRASLLGQLTRFWKQNYGFLETGEIDTRMPIPLPSQKPLVKSVPVSWIISLVSTVCVRWNAAYARPTTVLGHVVGFTRLGNKKQLKWCFGASHTLDKQPKVSCLLSVCLTVAWGRWCDVIFSSRPLRGRLLITFASRILWRSFNFQRISNLCNMHTWKLKCVILQYHATMQHLYVLYTSKWLQNLRSLFFAMSHQNCHL